MFDETLPKLERMRGRASVSIRAGGGLGRLAQAGAGKAFLPKVYGDFPEVVFLNTAGGLTGGDRLSYGLEIGAGARAVGTTQTAERAYRAGGGVAGLDVALEVGAGGRLDWLPQETILYDGAALHRRTEVRLSGDATVLMAEMVVLGRRAMGETVGTLEFEDRRVVTRDGRPVWIEPLRIDGGVIARPGAAGLAGATALVTVALIAKGAEDALTGVRARLGEVRAHASGWDGKLVVRAMAADPAPLRRMLPGVLEFLSGAPLPRVWQR